MKLEVINLKQKENELIKYITEFESKKSSKQEEQKYFREIPPNLKSHFPDDHEILAMKPDG